MLDQSYSYENFRIILDVENRKGNYLEDSNFFGGNDRFEISRKISKKIIEVNKSIREAHSNLPALNLRKSEDYDEINNLKVQKIELKKERDQALVEILRDISKEVNNNDFKVAITKGLTKAGKQLYITEDNPENYFVLKQLQRNIRKTFNVTQGDRKIILSQLKPLLSDNFPKLIIRTDISNFYESIPHKQLIDKIEENSLISFPSRKTIKEILNQYWKILLADGIKIENEERIGLPRGIGISAALSELFLKDLDKLISGIPNVTYYARYVDDIIIIITPNHRNENVNSNNYISQIKKITSRFNLQINDEKTYALDFRKSSYLRKVSRSYSLIYLGYEFVIKFLKIKDDSNKILIQQQPLCVCMSPRKKEKYITKINNAFDEFDVSRLKYAGKESKINNILLQRMKILTSNFRLFRRKDNILIGIYFSNEFLTNDVKDLHEFDIHFKNKLIGATPYLSNRTLKKLNHLSFKNGFEKKLTLNFNFNNGNKRGIVNIHKIIKIWSNL